MAYNTHALHHHSLDAALNMAKEKSPGFSSTHHVSSSSFQLEWYHLYEYKPREMEAAGLTIALLPLLISAAENYNNCIGPFLRYKRFSKEAGQFIQLLDVQKVIFRNECEILLENFIEKDVAASMLSNSNHPTWHDPQLHQQLVQLLGESEEACANIINLISGRLREVEQDCRDIVAALNNGEVSVMHVPLISS